jgi:phosphohistidine swiveling domain-containing protein
MKKPCIVGVKGVTDVLRDGDEVEVDANEGVVSLVRQKSGQLYRKAYTRENCLIAIQIWEEHQCRLLKEKVGTAVPLSIFDAYEGVVRVYYRHDIDDIWGKIIIDRATKDSRFVPDTMAWYGQQLDALEKIWKEGSVASPEALVELYKLASWAWVGLSISYFLPSLSGVTEKEQELGMKLRERSADFLELTDHAIQNTLHALHSDLGDLVKYLTIEEVRGNTIPSLEVLREREKHYIYYDFDLYSDVDIEPFLKLHNLEIQEEEITSDISELRGQTAMAGKVKGIVRVLKRKAEIPLLQEGEILVTAMTTPDYLPAMYKATAFITDEGGITCHAAIVARELKKPCVIGTKFATEILKNGDAIEVDADAGVVRILSRT